MTCFWPFLSSKRKGFTFDLNANPEKSRIPSNRSPQENSLGGTIQ
jgi:hypothetical protein